MWVSQRRLKSDVERWATAGWLTDDGARAIRGEMNARGGPGLAAVLAVLASVLLGFAAMSFVAANWQGMSKLARLLLLIGALWTAYGGAAALRQRGLERFAEAATLAGVGVFGASIMLISQMYHMEGNPPDAVLLWALGALLAGCLLGSNAALAAAMALAVLWSGWQMQITRGVHWPFLLLGAALAASYYWRRWWPGLHLALAGLGVWLVLAAEMVRLGLRYEVIFAVGFGLALVAAAIGAHVPRLSAATKVAVTYASVLAFTGAFGWQFVAYATKGTQLMVVAIGALALLLALIAWGWRTEDRTLVWLGYAGFSIEILGLYFKTIGTLLSTSLFFLVAGLIVTGLAWAAYRLVQSGPHSKEIAS